MMFRRNNLMASNNLALVNCECQLHTIPCSNRRQFTLLSFLDGCGQLLEEL
jgi:hypothetical protein